jgi:hypothetical protein
MVAQVRYSVVGQSRGRVAPCAVCTWHVETRSAGFLVEPQNWWRRFLPVWPQNRRSVSWLSLKTKVVEGFSVWASKHTALV